MKNYRERAAKFIPLLTAVSQDNDSSLSSGLTKMEARVKLREALAPILETDEVMALTLVGLSHRQIAFAIMLHDMPAGTRLRILDILPSDAYQIIIGYFSYIERLRSTHDPKGYFSPTITKSLLLDATGHHIPRIYSDGSSNHCYLCNKGFMEEGEDVVWKECKGHIMHMACFKVKVMEGINPLWGHCGCE